MIRADLHSHTKYSHGADEPEEMFAAANARGLEILGFSEHSPRPQGYDYTHEYREKLAAGFAEYVSRVQDLKKNAGLPRIAGHGNGLARRPGGFHPQGLFRP